MKINFNKDLVTLSHGSGGKATAQLIEQLFLRAFDNHILDQQNDGGCFTMKQQNLVMTTDSHVVTPLFFPGGNIGNLAINGTVNDIAVCGAIPRYLAASFILEEGFPLLELKRIVETMATSAKQAGISIITGDTKVVEKNKGDGVFITTTGIGERIPHSNVDAQHAVVGDKIILSGTIGEHGVAIMASRENLEFCTQIKSDTIALHNLVHDMLQAVPDIHCLRDITRGGLAAALNEIAQSSHVGMEIDESNIPIKEEVNAACELLGLEAWHVANEGKLIAICPAPAAKQLLASMQNHPLGQEAAIIGEVTTDLHKLVQLNTSFGGQRLMDWLHGEQLPRIC